MLGEGGLGEREKKGKGRSCMMLKWQRSGVR